jgi:hypothetical protein
MIFYQSVRIRNLFKNYNLNISLYFYVIFFMSSASLFTHCSELRSSPPPGDDRFPQIFRTTCLKNTEGCPCISTEKGFPVVRKFNHNDSVHRTGGDVKISEDYFSPDISEIQKAWIMSASVKSEDGSVGVIMTPIRHYKGREVCLYPAAYLREYKYTPVIGSKFNVKNHAALPLNKIVPTFNSENNNKIALGHYWITYYHMALEEHYPGAVVSVFDKNKKEIGRASKEFLDQVRWEGSGFRNNGDRIRWDGKPGEYSLYKDAVWGYGAGSGYHVYPYRTVAVNFPALCKKLYPDKPSCGKPDVIGTLIYIEEVAVRKIRMEDGRVHDGFFCASDTGSPDFIKEDRMDLFVGVHGGGNPYLPAERQYNLLLSGGIENLVPSDWKLWSGENDRVWCESDKLPKDIFNPASGDCIHDYHVQAAHKALTVYAIKDEKGNYIKCEKAPVINREVAPEKTSSGKKAELK